MTKGFSQRTVRAITWVATVATALSFVAPAAAFQSFPGSALYEWAGQNGTDDGSAHVINANPGDIVPLSLTMINRSADPQAKVWYGASAIIPEGASYPDAHKIGIGTSNPRDGMVNWLDASSFVSHGNRFMYYDGAPVFPGQSVTLTWNVKIAATATNGTYDLYVNGIREFDAWFRQTKNGKILPDADIFWRFNIGGPVTPGNLSVSASNMPAAQSVAKGSTNVTAATWRINNSASNATTLTGLTVKRMGIGSVTEISNGYLYQGSTRLTSGRSFNSSTNEASFTGLNLNIPANGYVDVSLLLDFNASATSNGQHQFAIENATKVMAGASTVGGSFPITSNMISVINASVGTVTLDAVGSTTAEANVGDTNIKMAEFKVSADSVEDAWLTRISLWQGGSVANAALTNLSLKQNGVTYATASGVDSKGYVVFNLTSPFKIERGNNRTFEVWGASAGRAADTIALYIDSSIDVYAKGGTNNSGMAVTFSDFDSTSSDHLTVTLKGGILTISFIGPSVADISNTANDAVIWKSNFTASSNLEIRNWYFTVVDTTAADPDLSDAAPLAGNQVLAAVQDVKIWNLTNNTVIAGPKEFTVGDDNTSEALVFTEDYTFTANQTIMIGLSVDIRNNPTTGNISLRADMTAFGTSDVRNVDSNSYLTPSTDIAPSGTISGYVQTVRGAGLTVALAPSPVSNTAVKGAGNTGDPYEAVAYNFTAGSGGTAKVNSITVTAMIDGDAVDATYDVDNDSGEDVNDYVLQLSLWDGATQIGTSKSLSTAGSVTFDSLNWMIAASQTKKLSLKIRLSTSPSVFPIKLAFGIDTGDITAVDQDGGTIASVPSADVNGTFNRSAQTVAVAPTVVTTVSSTGSLTVAQAADTPLAKIVIAGNTGVLLAKFRFTAVDEPFLLKKFGLVSQAAADNGRLAQLQVRYPVQGGGTATATVGLTGTANQVDISSNPMYVGQNQDAYLEVLGDLAAVTSFDDTQSAIDLIYGVDGDDNAATDNQATGAWSGTDDTSWSAADVNGNAQWEFRTKVVAQAGVNTSNLAGNAEQDLYKFTLRSDAANQGAVKQITFNAAITDVNANAVLTIGSLKLFKGSTNITSSVTIKTANDDSTLDESGTDTTNQIVIYWTTYETLSSTAQDYTLKGTPSNFSASDHDYMTIGLAGDTTYDADAAGVAVNSVLDTSVDATTRQLELGDRGTADTGEKEVNFIWSDFSTIPLVVTDDATGWFSGYLIDDLPTSVVQKTI